MVRLQVQALKIIIDMPEMNWRELQALNNSRVENGSDSQYAEMPDWLNGWDSSAPDAYEQYRERFRNNLSGYIDSAAGRRNQISELVNESLYERQPTPDEMLEAGYGQSKHDYEVPFNEWVKNPTDYRANSQSGLAKIMNGFAKMGVYTGTTFLDNTVGLVAGLAGIVDDATNGDNSFTPLTSFVSNEGFAEKMQSVRDWSEEVFPNYRTQKELDEQDQWWKHLNANFWGDTFIKNFGFTIGAGLSGFGFAKGFRALQGKTVNKAYKAAMAAAAGDGEANEVFRRVLQGEAMSNPAGIYKAFDKANRSFHRLQWESQLIGGIGGALGESRTEAINAAREFREDAISRETQRYEKAKDDLAASIANDERYSYYVNNEPFLNGDGIDLYNRELQRLTDEYQQSLGKIDTEATKLANRTFALNMPLLTASNIIMFGRMMSGGFKTQARAKVKMNNSGELYSAVGGKLGGAGKGLINATSEGLEEVSQKIFSEGTKHVASDNMAAFHNRQYDKDAIKESSEWLLDVLENAGSVVNDPKTWEEFTVGFLTGAIGMPARGGWAGGLYGGYKEVMDQHDAGVEAARKLNEKVSNPEFISRWKDVVRHKSLENAKNAALENNDQFTWRTVQDEQLLGDVLAFAKAGRLNDLEAFVDSLGNVTVDDIALNRSAYVDDTNPDFNRMSNEEVHGWLKDRVKDVKKTINQYRKFHDAIDFMSFGTSDEEAINELIYNETQLQNFEDRYNQIVNEVISDIRPRLEDVSRRYNRDGSPTKEASQAKRLLESESDLRRLFGGVVSDTRGDNVTENGEERTPSMIDKARQEMVLNTLDEWGVFADKPETKQKVSDLQKLVRGRQEFYSRLFDPSRRKLFAQKFDEQARTDDDVVTEVTEESRQNNVDNILSSLRKARNIREYVRSLSSIAPNDEQEAEMIDNAIGNDAELEKFNTVINDASEFVKALSDEIVEKIKNNTDVTMSPELDALQDIIDDTPINDMLADMQDDEEAPVHIARKLLDKTEGLTRAQNILRSMFDEAFGDLAKSEGLGVINPGSGPGTGEGAGTGAGGTGGGGAVSAFDHISELIDNIRDKDNDNLIKYSNGDFGELGEQLSDNQKASLASMAIAKLAALKKADGDINDPDVVDDGRNDDPSKESDSRKMARRERIAKEQASLNGSKIQVFAPGTSDESKYDVKYADEWGLRQGLRKKFRGKTEGMSATLAWYDSHKVQDFVDSGALMALERYHMAKNKSHLPIYFVANPHYLANNQANNPFVSENKNPDSKYVKYGKISPETLMAVEMDDENIEAIKRYKGIAFDDDSLITIDGKRYQVIGEVWNPTKDYISGIENEKDRDGYQRMKDYVGKLWENAIYNSVLPQYVNDKNAMDERGRWYVAKVHPQKGDNKEDLDYSSGERLSTTLSYVMSGRNETRSAAHPEYQKVELRNSMKTYTDVGGEYYFCMPVKGAEGFVISPGAERDGASWTSAINAPVGSLWMATRTANGNFSWTYITIARTGEYDFEANRDNSLISRLNDDLDNLFRERVYGNETEQANDFQIRLQACRDISDMFYLGIGNNILFSYTDTGIEVSIGGNICENKEEALQALKDGNFRFQVSKEAVETRNGLDELIGAGVLKSEMRSFMRFGSTFGVNFIEDQDENGNKVAPYAKTGDDSITFTAGADIASGYVTSSGISNVRIGEAGYMLENGKVYRMSAGNRRGQEVLNKITIAEVKALAEVMSPDFKRSSYSGRTWTIDRKISHGKKDIEYQYTELYENEIDGERVHLVRNGKNGAFLVCWDDSMWDSLVQYAKEVSIEMDKFRENGSPEADDVDLLKMFDEDRSNEGGQIENPDNTGGEQLDERAKRSRGKKGRGSRLSDPTSDTSQETSKSDQEALDEFDCGF